MNEILQRIDQILDLYGVTRTKFAEKIGMPQSTLTSIFKRENEKAIQTMAESALNIYADVRREWLMDGQGPMLKSQLEAGGYTALHEIISNLSKTIKEQQETISRLTKSQKKTAAVA